MDTKLGVFTWLNVKWHLAPLRIQKEQHMELSHDAFPVVNNTVLGLLLLPVLARDYTLASYLVMITNLILLTDVFN